MLGQRARFWFEVEDRFSAYNDIHEKLRPGGEWSGTEDGGPRSPEEWRRVEEYLLLFERGLMLYRDELISRDEFEHWYSYRLRNIVHNPVIAEQKLRIRHSNWRPFMTLLQDLGIEISPDRYRA